MIDDNSLSHFDIDLHGNENGSLNNDDLPNPDHFFDTNDNLLGDIDIDIVVVVVSVVIVVVIPVIARHILFAMSIK